MTGPELDAGDLAAVEAGLAAIKAFRRTTYDPPSAEPVLTVPGSVAARAELRCSRCYVGVGEHQPGTVEHATPEDCPGRFTCPGCGVDRDPEFTEPHAYDCPAEQGS